MADSSRILDIELRQARASEEEVRAFVNACRRGQGLAEGSAELWAWRAWMPGGAILGLARDAGGELCAALVALRHRALLEGARTHFGEVVELANAFERGKGLARSRALIGLAEAFARNYGGAAPEGMPFVYGVPTRRAHRILRRAAKAEVLRSENLLWARPSSLDWPKTGVEVCEVDGDPEPLDELFMRWSAGRRAVLVRGRDQYAWRYGSHPSRRYRCAFACRGDERVGFAVLRLGDMDGEPGGILADWMTMPGDREAGMELLRWARDVAAERDMLFVNVSDRTGEFALFQSLGFRVRGTREYLTFRGFRRPTVMSWLFANWTYTLGDSERG